MRDDLPTGTVTLLFSDIEGSTRLLRQLGDRYIIVLTECRHILRSAFQQWNGYEVDNAGSSRITFHDHADTVHALTWLPDGKHIASVSGDRTIKVWRVI